MLSRSVSHIHNYIYRQKIYQICDMRINYILVVSYAPSANISVSLSHCYTALRLVVFWGAPSGKSFIVASARLILH
jgi:hypothetical protein